MRLIKNQKIHTVTELLDSIFESVSLLVALIGFAFIVIAYILQTGAWAAILPVWGTALLILGIGSYGLTWWIHHKRS